MPFLPTDLSLRDNTTNRHYLLDGILQSQEPLPEKYHDHPLIGNHAGFRDCHISPNWVVIYRADKKHLELHRTGTHSDLLSH